MAKGKYQEWLTKEGLIRLVGWARDGLTDQQIAENMGITAKTLYDWKNKHSEICKALKEGKDVPDRNVENALYKRARGYDAEEVIEERDPDTGQMVVTRRVVKHIPPDPTSMIFYLKNRKPDEWRDKRQTELTGAEGGPLNVRWMAAPDEVKK